MSLWDPLFLKYLFLFKAYYAPWLFRWRSHKLAYSFKGALYFHVMLFGLSFEFVKLMNKVFMGREDLPQFNECPYYSYIDLDGALTVKNA